LKNVKLITLEYPRLNDVDTLEIDLCDVRASDGIRITYDFDRDGWVMWQPKGVEMMHCDACDVHLMNSKGEEEWVEVAFAKSWAKEFCAGEGPA
jgi:hypothetical protein